MGIGGPDESVQSATIPAPWTPAGLAGVREFCPLYRACSGNHRVPSPGRHRSWRCHKAHRSVEGRVMVITGQNHSTVTMGEAVGRQRSNEEDSTPGTSTAGGEGESAGFHQGLASQGQVLVDLSDMMNAGEVRETRQQVMKGLLQSPRQACRLCCDRSDPGALVACRPVTKRTYPISDWPVSPYSKSPRCLAPEVVAVHFHSTGVLGTEGLLMTVSVHAVAKLET